MASNVHCAFCFDTLYKYLQQPLQSLAISPAALPMHTDKFPMFITWKKRPTAAKNNNSFLANLTSSSHTSNAHVDWRLRGCIGTFTPHSLPEGLSEYAIISAVRDSRFSPIRASELPLLRCDVSLLMNFTAAKDYTDWEVGTHGITIDFSPVSSQLSNARNNRGRYNATYLPEVALEQDWTIEETVESLIRKAGFQGDITEELLNSIKLTRYESSKSSLTHDEYLIFKQEWEKTHKPTVTLNGNGVQSHQHI